MWARSQQKPQLKRLLRKLKRNNMDEVIPAVNETIEDPSETVEETEAVNETETVVNPE